MVDTPNNSELFSPFLPATSNIPEEQDRLKTFLYDQFGLYADVINGKKIGNYTQNTETQNGEIWGYDSPGIPRNGFQTIARIKNYPNTGVLILTLTSDPQFPIQNIDPEFVVTNVYGSASKPCSAIGAGDGIYFSFYSRGDPRITFDMTDISITITTTVDLSAYSGYIVIEYLRRGRS